MPRPKEFDRDDALEAAVRVFWRQGFAVTTTDDLVKAMGIGRQSFYNTFGDKRRCFLEALRVYAREEVSTQFDAVGVPTTGDARDAATPLQSLRAFLGYIAERPSKRRLLGCMVVNALAEQGDEPDVIEALGPSSQRLRETLVELLRAAKARGEVSDSLEEKRAAHALLITRMGLMLSAKAGQPPALLRQVADFAIDQLRTPADTIGLAGSA